MVVEKPENRVPVEFGVLRKLAIVPACQPVQSANPKCSLLGGEQADNPIGWEMLVRWRLPRDVSDPVKAQQAEISPQPKVAVGCLCDRIDLAFGKAVADSPRGVSVL